jgi:protease I
LLPGQPALKENQMEEASLKSKKAAMIIAFRGFRDEEYFVSKAVLEKAGVQVETFSDAEGTAIGSQGGQAAISALFGKINPRDYDAVIFIGGQGALAHLDNEQSYQLIRQTLAQGKILAAICVSPSILAKAGALDNKKATVWSSPLNRSTVKVLKEQGAIYLDKPVVVDNKIVTANGPAAAEEFGETLTDLLKQVN